VSQVQETNGDLNLSKTLSVFAKTVELESLLLGTFALLLPKLLLEVEFVNEEADGFELTAPGLGVIQEMHLSASDLFFNRQVSHSQLPGAGLNLSKRELLSAGGAAFCVSAALGVWHAIHLSASFLF
jgi:hypothetical protein